MAGTTVDEKNVVYQTVRRAINDSGYHFSQEQVQAAGAGKEKSQAIRDVLALDGAEHSDQEISTIFAHFKIMLAKAYEELDVQPQPGTLEVFKALRAANAKVALNTGYDRQTAEKLIDKLGWRIGDDFDVLVTASDVSNGRPHADMIQLAMSKVGVADLAVSHDAQREADLGTAGREQRGRVLSEEFLEVRCPLSDRVGFLLLSLAPTI